MYNGESYMESYTNADFEAYWGDEQEQLDTAWLEFVDEIKFNEDTQEQNT
jgi:hypothetical protein